MKNYLTQKIRKKIKIIRYINQFKHISNVLPEINSYPQKKFIIFGQGRSGSTLLVSLMNCHSEIFCDGEIMSKEKYGKILFPLKYINLSSRYAPKNGKSVYGFKVKIYQLSRDQKYNNYLDILNTLNSNGWYFIHLRRSNILKQCLSVQIYLAHGFAHNKNKKKLSRRKIKIDLERLKRQMKERTIYCKKEDEFLTNISHLSINYENDLLNSEKHQDTANKIFKYLGLNECEVNTSYRKIASDKIEDNIENYDELCTFLKSEGYEHFLL